MDKKLIADILAVCNTLGYSDGNKYMKDPECLASVKDLILYLRRDDDNHSIRRLLGRSEVVQKDLLPLIKWHSSDLELHEVVLRLLVNLTNPALLVYEEYVPQNKTYRNYFQQITEHLQSYKQAFADELLWKRIDERLKKLIAKDWEARLESDRLTIERILLLIRNVLQVPADPAEEKRSDDDASVHDQVVHVLHSSGLLERLLTMSKNSDTADDYCLHLLEIITLILREQRGEQLATTVLQRTAADIKREEEELAEIVAREAQIKSIAMKKQSVRHSRFGGTFTVRDLKAPSGRDLLCHKPVASVGDLSLDAGKKAKRTARNRLPLNEVDATRRSTLSIRLTLQNFCSRFLQTSYNFLMRLVRDKIDRSKTQDHDETYFLWAMKFFMEFNRFHKFHLKHVHETMNVNTFHYVQTLLDNYQGMMLTDKDKTTLWSKRSHSALKAYQELLSTLFWLDKTRVDLEAAESIKRTVFYLPEYRELCFTLLNNFDPVKFSKLYFYDLVETNHLFLKLLEEYSRNPENRKVVVKVKKKKEKVKVPKKRRAKKAKTIKMDGAQLEESWGNISGSVSEAVTSTPSQDETVNIFPFDAALDLSIEEQKPIALNRIAIFLHTEQYKEAVILLRSSKEVWLDFLQQVDAEGLEDVDAMRAIYMAKSNGLVIPPPPEPPAPEDLPPLEPEPNAEGAEEPAEEPDELNFANEVDEVGESEEEEHDDRFEEAEVDIKFTDFLEKYANSKIISHYGRAFKDWETVKPLTFQCVLKLFHRVGFQLGLYPLICQLSVFKTFQQILKIPKPMPHLQEAVGLFYHLWPKFTDLCEKYPNMFLELLFWKQARDCAEFDLGEGAFKEKEKTKSSKGRKKREKKEAGSGPQRIRKPRKKKNANDDEENNLDRPHPPSSSSSEDEHSDGAVSTGSLAEPNDGAKHSQTASGRLDSDSDGAVSTGSLKVIRRKKSARNPAADDDEAGGASDASMNSVDAYLLGDGQPVKRRNNTIDSDDEDDEVVNVKSNPTMRRANKLVDSDEDSDGEMSTGSLGGLSNIKKNALCPGDDEDSRGSAKPDQVVGSPNSRSGTGTEENSDKENHVELTTSDSEVMDTGDVGITAKAGENTMDKCIANVPVAAAGTNDVSYMDTEISDIESNSLLNDGGKDSVELGVILDSV